MAFQKKRRLDAPSVNAGSMADIAFLLLIFFLVTTTILEDKGIRVMLPVWQVDVPREPIPENNVLNILVNSSDEVLIEKERASIEVIRERTKQFIMNPRGLETLPSNPKKAIVSLQNDRSTSYRTYVEVYNEIKAAYNELWEEASKTRFSRSYSELNEEERRDVRKDIPLVISESDPTDVEQTM